MVTTPVIINITLSGYLDLFFQIRNWLQGTYTLRILENFFDIFIAISPYLAISILLNIAALRWFQRKKIHFTARNEIVSLLIAGFIGLLSPIPTYAAIPIGINLLAMGIPFSSIIAFVICSPLMNPSIFFITGTQMGWEMAIVRTLTAYVLGVTAGLLTIKIFKSLSEFDRTKFNFTPRPERPLGVELLRNSIYVLKYFSFAIFISAAVKALVPPEVITSLLGGNAKTSTLVAMGLGIPFYTCGGAAVPFVKTLMDMGMSKGATLAFFTAGPATKVETLYAFKRLLGVKILLFYLALTLIFAYAAGLLYSLI